MGLDIVELFMRAEEDFAIEIGDEEAVLCATAGQLCRLIALKLGVEPDFDTASPSGCPSSAAFYRTRRELMDLTGLSRSEIRPKTPMPQVFAAGKRRRMWNRFRAQSTANLPDLEMPILLRNAMILGLLTSWTLGYACAAAGEILGAMGWGLGGLCCLAAFASNNPFARRFPASCATVGDLNRYNRLLPSATAAETEQSGIWPRVRFLIADELSVPLESVTPDADFVRDLGAG